MVTRVMMGFGLWLAVGLAPLVTPVVEWGAEYRESPSAFAWSVPGWWGGSASELLVQEARHPVLLVPGWSDQAADMEPLRQRFLAAGWDEEDVQVVEFRDPFGSNRSNAREVADAVGVLHLQSQTERVDVVAHSMGGLATRYFLTFEGGEERVRRVVFLGTPHRGTVAAVLAWGEGGREMVPGSDFLEKLNNTSFIPFGVEALAIRTALDLRVIPASSAILPGAENVEICCPTHQGMVDDDRTFQEALTFLQREDSPGNGSVGTPPATTFPGIRP